LAALKTLAGRIGDVFVLAPRDPHSYAGHRVTTDCPLVLAETGSQEFTLTGTPADCVRLGVSTLFPEIDWVLSGINRGGNLGADLFTSGTVAAVREAALLGRPGIAISQYIRKGVALDWDRSVELALPVIEQLIAEGCPHKGYWNVNLPHVDAGESAAVIRCVPDNEPLDIRFRQDGDRFHYDGSYRARRRTPGRDTELCFGGAITVSSLRLD
jgi:5'-nucleotidase